MHSRAALGAFVLHRPTFIVAKSKNTGDFPAAVISIAAKKEPLSAFASLKLAVSVALWRVRADTFVASGSGCELGPFPGEWCCKTRNEEMRNGNKK